MDQCCCCCCLVWVLDSTAPDNTTVADASGHSTHTRNLSLNHTLFLHQPAHTYSRSLSLSVSSLSLARSLARSLTLSLTHTCTRTISLAHPRIHSNCTHSLSLRVVCPSLSYLLSFASTLSISDVHRCAIFHSLQTHTHQAHQLLAEWADFYLNQFIFI